MCGFVRARVGKCLFYLDLRFFFQRAVAAFFALTEPPSFALKHQLPPAQERMLPLQLDQVFARGQSLLQLAAVLGRSSAQVDRFFRMAQATWTWPGSTDARSVLSPIIMICLT